jgi:hypothetical protein
MMRWNVLNKPKKLTGISWNVSHCVDMGIIGKYPKYVPKYFQLHNTLLLWWLREVTHRTYGGNDAGSHFVPELL